MLWLNFLHLYQPANANEQSIREATEKSYARLIKVLEENPQLKFTFNITGCLVLRLAELGYFELLEKIKKLIADKQLEITGSAAYHPLLPLIPKAEIIRQIKENEKILQSYFGIKPQGFFFPELAFNNQTLSLIKSLGYKWVILDEMAASSKIKLGQVYQDRKSDLKIIFRSRKLSSGYVPDILKNLIIDNQSATVVTATDAELYGLRHEDPTGELEKLIKADQINTLTFSEYIHQEKLLPAISLRPSSWESTAIELKHRRPFVLWHDRKNKIQLQLWGLANFAYDTLEKNRQDKNYDWARWHFVRGLASCTFWWASGKDFKKIFGPIAWNPDQIEGNMSELLRAVRSLQGQKTLPAKIKAEKMYAEIRFLIWQEHWKKYWK